MQNEPASARNTSTIDGTGTQDNGGRVIDRTPLETTTRRYATPSAGTYTDENVLEVKNRVQWGPIIAGVLTALGTLLLLTVLGLAVGSSAFEPGTDASDWGTGAGIWGAISAILALFAGGWVAAKTAAVGGKFSGLMNGLMAGLATVLLLIWLTTTGLSNVLGFLGNNIADITSVASDTFGVDVDDVTNTDGATTGADVDAAADDAQASVTNAATSEETYDRVRDGAWGTFIALLLALGAAAVGGLIGSNRRADLVEGTGRA
jgi:hypothetical protein